MKRFNKMLVGFAFASLCLLSKYAIAIEAKEVAATKAVAESAEAEDAAKEMRRLKAEETIKAIKDAESRGVKPTRANIEENVRKAAKFVAKEGASYFDKLMGKDSEYINSNACYIYVVDMKGNMICHPVLHELEGTNAIRLRDKTGRMIVAPITQIEDGWYDYWWPRPGETTPERKSTYVKRTTMPDGTVVALASGAYDIPEQK